MKRTGLLVLLVAALGVTSLLANHKGRGLGRGGRSGAGVFWNGPGRGDGLPPGLARRGPLPPGLQRRVGRTGQLPLGLHRNRGGWQRDPGVFTDRDRRGRKHRRADRQFHRRSGAAHRKFHQQHPNLEDREVHGRFHRRQREVHGRFHRRPHDGRNNGFGRRDRRLPRHRGD